MTLAGQPGDQWGTHCYYCCQCGSLRGSALHARRQPGCHPCWRIQHPSGGEQAWVQGGGGAAHTEPWVYTPDICLVVTPIGAVSTPLVVSWRGNSLWGFALWGQQPRKTNSIATWRAQGLVAQHNGVSGILCGVASSHLALKSPCSNRNAQCGTPAWNRPQSNASTTLSQQTVCCHEECEAAASSKLLCTCVGCHHNAPQLSFEHGMLSAFRPWSTCSHSSGPLAPQSLRQPSP